MNYHMQQKQVESQQLNSANNRPVGAKDFYLYFGFSFVQWEEVEMCHPPFSMSKH